jgi:hypothetical protein
MEALVSEIKRKCSRWKESRNLHCIPRKPEDLDGSTET